MNEMTIIDPIKIETLLSALGETRAKKDEPMREHTYFKIGGPADLFFEAQSSEDIIQAVTLSIKHDVPYFVLGGGSNILVGDKGCRGLVIKNRADKIQTIRFKGNVKNRKVSVKEALVEAETGAMLNQLSRYCIEEGLRGFEFFLSVPGTVGGALFNNSHYRPENDEFVGNLVHTATLITHKGDVKEVEREYFKFRYDYSRLHETHETVVKATFALKATEDKATLWQEATQLVKRRNERQPIGIACSGCTFRNITRADALRLGTPNLTQSTGFLIDKAGLKGTMVGKAKVNELHASFIENTGGATAKEVMALIELIKRTVKEKFDVDLALEIFLVGEF